MTALEILSILQEEIHSTVFATVDENGLPHTCVMDLMLADESGLFFLTARGKPIHDRLTAKPYAALSGMKGQDTLSTVAISVRGPVRNLGNNRLDEILDKNTYMKKIYPSPQSREALEVFQMYQGEGEYFDLSQLPPTRISFSFGGQKTPMTGYTIKREACIGCQECLRVCPTGCISAAVPRTIEVSHCICCGNCQRICPENAVKRLE